MIDINKYNNKIYKMYEEEVIKNKQAPKLIKSLELEIYVLKRELKLSENKINNAVKTATKPLIDANNKLQNNLSKAYCCKYFEEIPFLEYII